MEKKSGESQVCQEIPLGTEEQRNCHVPNLLRVHPNWHIHQIINTNASPDSTHILITYTFISYITVMLRIPHHEQDPVPLGTMQLHGAT